ncbi:MAG: putative molybdenum carrier protein [Gammaproteobacteria bacterium]|nr:putative molybdenum carrier protein [Gammaproteobacteria bacterium]
MTIKQVISGGQTGADLGALVGARRAGVSTGGYCPKGYRTEKGPQPVLAQYGLIEHSSADYTPRTIANVKLADATIIFITKAHSPGTEKSLSATVHYCKPHFTIDPFASDAEKKLIAFLEKQKPQVINIAGPRESQQHGIGKKVASIVEHVLLAVNVTKC